KIVARLEGLGLRLSKIRLPFQNRRLGLLKFGAGRVYVSLIDGVVDPRQHYAGSDWRAVIDGTAICVLTERDNQASHLGTHVNNFLGFESSCRADRCNDIAALDGGSLVQRTGRCICMPVETESGSQCENHEDCGKRSHVSLTRRYEDPAHSTQSVRG